MKPKRRQATLGLQATDSEISGAQTVDDDPVQVLGFDQTVDGVWAGDLERLQAIAKQVLDGEEISNGRLDLVLVGVEQITELNEQHMDKSGPTDVLSFPLDDPDEYLGNEAVEVHLGDVVLCPSVAASQAPEHCGSVEAELALLVIHGVLHVLGHDHGEAAEAAEMLERERHYLASIGYEHPGPMTQDRSKAEVQP